MTGPEAIRDLAAVGTDILTLGQYLAPSPDHVPVARFLPPEEFAELRSYALDPGFGHVEAGPLVRSSYHAERQVEDMERRHRSGAAVSPGAAPCAAAPTVRDTDALHAIDTTDVDGE